ncbi:hypothetical protein F5144DRAFT_490261 [Chaetomium tenue]|uniref:Uncharacterized protein n=1 Tax=Chaetomium tenue TaxID=1854479 RepID=A0ACB7PAE6_9PEZI|nr:hypothetical protein F5144DRAFT_490261 [Chaetomium globosum]
MGSGTPEGPGGHSTASMADLDHNDLGPNIIAANFVCWAIAFVFVLLRFWTRARIVRALGVADWFIAASLIAALGMCISNAEQVKYGKGKHVWDIDKSDNVPRGEVFRRRRPQAAWWFSLLFYVLSLGLTKVSICLLFLTIFTLEWARRACYVVLGIVAITSLWAVGVTLTYCIPLEASWDHNVQASFCQNQDTWWANTGLIIVTDLMIFILPIPIVSPLKLPRRQKFVVVGIFAIGFFVCLVELIRLAILIEAKKAKDADSTYTNTDLAYWTTVEIHTAIVVACAMTLRPLVTRFCPRLFDPYGNNGGGGDGSGEGSGESGLSKDGRPPLTIGSRPSRLRGLQNAMGVGGGVGDGEGDCPGAVALGDVERGVAAGGGGSNGEGGERGKSARAGLAYGPEPGPGPDPGVNPWVKGDAASERTEDLGRQATARSIG